MTEHPDEHAALDDLHDPHEPHDPTDPPSKPIRRKTKAIRNRHLSPAPHWRSLSPVGVVRRRPLPRCA